ncbi:MAG: tRNA1(Val) (adenine(37)-N6)-methyltransferase [Syntrophales bacterium]
MDADVPSDAAVAGQNGETVDVLPGGRLRIIQPKSGYRFSLDALLLAHFAVLKEGEAAIDLGTGSGIVALLLACRCPGGRVLGIDIQEELVAMARRSAELNGLAGSVEIRHGDIRRPESLFAPASFDVAVFNPPYRRLRSGRTNPDPAKAVARHEVAGSAADFLAAASLALRRGGRAYAIYPVRRMVELLVRMRAAGIEPKRLRTVHSRRGGRGEFVLVEGVKGGREELTVLAPLVIYSEGTAYTAEMAALFQELTVSRAPGGGRSPAS